MSFSKKGRGVIKGKVVLPCRCGGGLVSVHAMNMYEYVSGGQARLILNLGIRWGELLAAFTERFTSDKKIPRYPLNVGLGGLGIRSGPCGNSKKSFATLEHQTTLTPRTSPWPTQFTD